ncbi:hypothetical protein [Burkholderia sp. SCN-KJ]|uniref:hypothetical protein n=1 Tax=Burkholderia sp. SCN-KJ TaxID=2969248 RepID=UPI00214F9C92|nr:hypothetical protein [Burkholderia sp. SCN-KJ]MCR4471499.1 hypothetical protein [Burkholderia sp. SCN-KJ]
MWRTWPGHDGNLMYAMTMITVNADDQLRDEIAEFGGWVKAQLEQLDAEEAK